MTNGIIVSNHYIEQFARVAQDYADKIALYYNNNNYSYQTIDRLSDKIAQQISQYAFPKETIIPLVLERTPNLIITMIGILKSGCAFLPISPSSPCSRIEYILEEIKAKLIFCDISAAFKIADGAELINPDTAFKYSDDMTPVFYAANDLAYVMYTSGSTGKPKGVLIEQHSMMNLFTSLSETLDLSSDDLFLALTDYTFDISLIELLMPLVLGATIVLTEHGTVADGKKIKYYLSQFDISFMQATPLTWEILLKNGWQNNGNLMILVGGEQFKTSLASRLHYEKGNIWNVYGPTETSMWSMVYPLHNPITTESVPLGKPLANTYLKLIYEENSSQAELYIGGLGVARGYLNAPELTQSKFITDENDGIRYYKTGDLVMPISNDTFCYVGRIDNQLKFGGIRIEAGEIEATIEQDPFVKKAVVKVHEHNDYYKTMAAYVEIDEKTLFSHKVQIVNEDSSHYIEKIYDEVYSQAKKYESQLANTCGWQSSFTGEIFQDEELAESYIHIRQYIKNSDLTQVLEVGCGTGHLLLEYLPQAEQVTLVEISQKAIDYVQSIIPKDQCEKVSFKLESLVNLHEEDRYSCIIINSVIQYLPSIKLLMDSLKQLIKATKAGGTILIGDVRSLELLDFYLTIKQAYHNPNDVEICPSSLFYKSRDSEIALSPFFFLALKQQFKKISWIDINVKHGDYPNELNYFRYDVIIHIDKPIQQVECQILNFEELPDIREWLIQQNKPLIIQNIPYDYFATLCKRLSLEQHPYLKECLRNTSQLIDASNKKMTPALLKDDYPGFETFVQYQHNAPHSHLQMLFVPLTTTNTLIRPLIEEEYEPFHVYCREPFSPWLQQFCFEHIKMNVKKHVMGWVNPSIYIWVEQWPQTINGKLDRKKLQLPSTYHPEQDKSSILSQLKHIWLNITGAQALITEEFWTHGISSLSMYYFLATINETFHVHMTYHEFHQYNTMEKVAYRIEELLQGSKQENPDER